MWADGLVELHERIGGRFGWVEPRRRALAYLRRLLSQVERKNSCWLAEQAGEQTPDGTEADTTCFGPMRFNARAGMDPDR